MSDINSLTVEQLREMVVQLQQNQKKDRALSFKVQEKGTVSVYGLQKFPVTLYPTQWEKLAKAMPEIMSFIESKKEELTAKISKAA